MALQFSTTVRNARLDAIEVDAGVSAILKLRSGAAPANCGTADSGTVLATLNLPSDWMTAAAAGVKGKSGTWQDLSADAAGTIGHFRIYRTDGTTVVLQGSCGIGTGDMQLDNTNVAVAQVVTVTAFDITDGNA